MRIPRIILGCGICTDMSVYGYAVPEISSWNYRFFRDDGGIKLAL